LEEVLIVKKQTLILIALILIPLIAVAIAISPGSVMVFQNQTLTTISFAEPLEGVDFGWCAPVALILTYVLFAAVVIYALTKKQTVLKIVRGVGFVAMSLVALPIIVRSEVLIVPNAFVGMLLAAHWLISHFTLRSMNPKQEEKPKGKRLKAH
jgi:hypothetical protein